MGLNLLVVHGGNRTLNILANRDPKTRRSIDEQRSGRSKTRKYIKTQRRGRPKHKKIAEAAKKRAPKNTRR